MMHGPLNVIFLLWNYMTGTLQERVSSVMWRHDILDRNWFLISMFHHAFFNSIIDKHQHMHFFTFKTVLA